MFALVLSPFNTNVLIHFDNSLLFNSKDSWPLNRKCIPKFKLLAIYFFAIPTVCIMLCGVLCMSMCVWIFPKALENFLPFLSKKFYTFFLLSCLLLFSIKFISIFCVFSCCYYREAHCSFWFVLVCVCTRALFPFYLKLYKIIMYATNSKKKNRKWISKWRDEKKKKNG
jgi:hypothetical protein